MMMRPLPIALVLALVLAAPAGAATKNVKIGDDYFIRSGSAPTITVTKGTTVKWNWKGSRQHNVVVQKGPVKFQSALKRSGSYERRMKKVGTYRIVCSIHAPDMAMSLKVKKN
jgi:plastocyanin